MARYIAEGDIYELLQPTGIGRIHVSQIDVLPRADVVPKTEVAREIFEELEYHSIDGEISINSGYFAELKKKYTEDQHGSD